MAKTSGGVNGKSKSRQALKTKARPSAKAPAPGRATTETARAAGWATNLVFDVREPKLAVSLRLDADVLRFFRGFGAGYQTRINEVLKAFMQARSETGSVSPAVANAGATRASNGKRASR
jgi:uncharacterized protein (DUF4415 family)